MRLILIYLFTFINITNLTYAESIENVSFKSQQLQKRYQILIEDIRCPVCQGQSIGGSNASLAQDLRKKVREMLLQEKTDADIFDFMRARYGDFVIFKPPVNQQTYILWFAPFLFIIFGAFVLWRKKTPNQPTNQASNKNAVDLTKAQELLK